MKKGWWVALSIVLIITNISYILKLKNFNRNSINEEIFIKGSKEKVSIPSKKSVLTLIVYFSNNGCGSCVEVVDCCNRLFTELKLEEIFILGLVPEKRGYKD